MNLQDKRAATFPMINCPPGKGGLEGSLGGTGAIGDILSDTNILGKWFCNPEYVCLERKTHNANSRFFLGQHTHSLPSAYFSVHRVFSPVIWAALTLAFEVQEGNTMGCLAKVGLLLIILVANSPKQACKPQNYALKLWLNCVECRYSD